jgi:hypothetical protein
VEKGTWVIDAYRSLGFEMKPGVASDEFCGFKWKKGSDGAYVPIEPVSYLKALYNMSRKAGNKEELMSTIRCLSLIWSMSDKYDLLVLAAETISPEFAKSVADFRAEAQRRLME